MRPKIVVPALIILLGIFAFLFFHRREQSSLQATTQELTSSNIDSSITNRTVSAAPQTTQPSLANSIPVVNDRVNTNEIRQYMESQNVPVAFYGKVIDQDGNPISGARVKGEVLHVKVMAPAPFGAADEIIPINETTDSGGQFQVLNVSGRSFDLDSIQKDGYEVEPENCPHVFGATGSSFDNPVSFKMWNTNIHEQLITGSYKFQIVPDGRPYYIDLMKGEISQTQSGDLRVWIKFPQQTELGQYYDWSCEIEALGGGLQPSDSYSMFAAPADGYVPTFSLQQKIRDGQRGSIGDRKFYITLDNGKIFGRIQIDLIAPFNTGIPGMVRLSYAINPSGSRILR
jgi:hypothetical protein